jgi:hypothetical protein
MWICCDEMKELLWDKTLILYARLSRQLNPIQHLHDEMGWGFASSISLYVDRIQVVCNIEAQRYTHSRSSGSTDGSRKGRTSDSSQHFKRLFVVEEEGSGFQSKTKNCIQPSAAPGPFWWRRHFFFSFLLSTQLQLRALSMVKSAHVNETHSLETDSLSSEISTLLNTLGWNRDDIISWYKVKLPYLHPYNPYHIIPYPFLLMWYDMIIHSVGWERVISFRGAVKRIDWNFIKRTR